MYTVIDFSIKTLYAHVQPEDLKPNIFFLENHENQQ